MNVLNKLDRYYNEFKGEKFSIGKTYLGKDIYCFCVSKTLHPKIVVTYSIHAREYITTFLALKQIERFRKHGKRGTVYFIPAVNPDGIEICLKAKPLYKANARGVDLNVNFDAGWGKGKTNVFSPADENYVGKCPFSERETRALRDFTLAVNPSATISYHSKGEEIYYEFHQDEKAKRRDYLIAEKLAFVTGYKIKSTPNSYGGYKDWCIERLKIPAFTIEVGKDNLKHPITRKNLGKIYRKNKKVICTLTESI